MLLRLALAAVAGGLIGLERERVEAAAGLRTHALVCVGATLFMLVSMFGFADAGQPPAVILDPSRVGAQIVSGIGFLGAGVIIFRKEIIRGLTTAASIWVVAAVGMAIGGGLYVAAASAAALVLSILAIMKPLERRMNAIRRRQVVVVTIDHRKVAPSQIGAWFEAEGLRVERMDVRTEASSNKTQLSIALRQGIAASALDTIPALTEMPGVREVRSAFTTVNGTVTASVPQAVRERTAH